MVYRFKIVYEDHEDISREIEIRSGQTFEDFHNTIQEAYNFDNKHNASFYISDERWRKGLEITLRSENGTEKKLMNKAKLGAYIDDPHQKILYIFDPSTQWIYHIELQKIVDEQPKATYPRITKSSGASPKQYKVVVAPAPDEDDEIDEEEEDNKKEKIFNSEEGVDKENDDTADMLMDDEEDAPATDDAEEGDPDMDADADDDQPEGAEEHEE